MTKIHPVVVFVLLRTFKNFLIFFMKRLTLLVAGLVLLAFNSFAQPGGGNSPDAAYVKANYTKYEYQIPMRDGIKLFTSVYVPKDDSKKYPILMKRTPYSVAPYGVDNTTP